ncbi:GntR family transcriptional repressor for pyruvate dehydrogenase complex [Lysinibacillus sp. RC46]|uniref:FadR/GntR family transcriptional regulator n=1 Tax=unclassified Lysinibacillus TaxID=2636778 RepID=UPI0035128026
MMIERKSISNQVLEEILEMIKNDELSVGSLMPSEHDLVTHFGVSRAPIREALKVLEVSGIISSKQGGRSRINSINLSDMLAPIRFEVISLEEILDLLEFRIHIESSAASLAAERRTEEELEALKEAVQQFEEVYKCDYDTGQQIDFAFHKLIMQASHNQFFIDTQNNLSELYIKALQFSLSKNLGLEKKRNEVLEEHRKIVEAIERKDARAASSAMILHLTNARNKLESLK